MAEKKPPTEAQLLRIAELLENPALDDYLETISAARFTAFMKTTGGAGILIGLLKTKISEQAAR